MDQQNSDINSEKLKAPGYYSTKPQFELIKRLKKILGYYDAIPTTIELVFQDYIKECEQNNIKLEDALRESSKNFIVKNHNPSSFNDMRWHAINFYILNIFNVIDPYFRDLKSLLIDLNNIEEKDWKTKKDKNDLDAFNQVIENCKKADRNFLKSKPEYHLLNYYRLHRNAVVHRIFKKDDQFKISEKYFDDHLNNHISYFNEIYKLDAPNKSGEIKFDDFLMYTRAIKYFNNLVNDACFNLSEDNLVEKALSNESLSKNFNGYKNATETKKIKLLKKYLKDFFLVDNSPEIQSFYQNYLHESSRKKQKI